MAAFGLFPGKQFQIQGLDFLCKNLLTTAQDVAANPANLPAGLSGGSSPQTAWGVRTVVRTEGSSCSVLKANLFCLVSMYWQVLYLNTHLSITFSGLVEVRLGPLGCPSPNLKVIRSIVCPESTRPPTV